MDIEGCRVGNKVEEKMPSSLTQNSEKSDKYACRLNARKASFDVRNSYLRFDIIPSRIMTQAKSKIRFTFTDLAELVRNQK